MVLTEIYTNNCSSTALKLLTDELEQGNIILPEYSFFIDTNPKVARERIIKRNGTFESKESLSMLIRAYSIWQNYLNKYSIEKIDGNLEIDKITNKVLQRVLENEK